MGLIWGQEPSLCEQKWCCAVERAAPSTASAVCTAVLHGGVVVTLLSYFCACVAGLRKMISHLLLGNVKVRVSKIPKN